MRWCTAVLICAIAIAGGPCFAEGGLEQLFRENSHVLTLTNGKLSGAGIGFLLAEGEDAQFLCLAEPHNSHDIPIFVTSLFKRLQEDLSLVSPLFSTAWRLAVSWCKPSSRKGYGIWPCAAQPSRSPRPATRRPQCAGRNRIA